MCKMFLIFLNGTYDKEMSAFACVSAIGLLLHIMLIVATTNDEPLRLLACPLIH